MFIGRGDELQFLESRYRDEKGQLVVLYGRRRVGKTETLHYFCKDKPHMFFSCRECTDSLQLQNFSHKMAEEGTLPGYIREYSDWYDAFEAVLELPYGDKKRLVVIDEFPYMCKGNESIPSILQNLWDEKLKDANVMLILCGSAMSFIENELLAEKNPLYGRATGIYKMKEMGFYDAVKFFPKYSHRDKVLAYSVLGGIPHYLKQFDGEKTLEENIKQNILTRGCPLYSEIEFMLRQELRETSLYNSIIEAVALGSTKVGEINDKARIGNTSKTSVYLKNLIELEIVEREFSVSDGIKEQGNQGRGLYQLTDPFFRFWYSFVFANYSELENGDVDGVYQYVVEPRLNQFASMAFEGICREYIRRLQREERLPFHYSRMGRWWGKTAVQTEDGKKRTVENELDIAAFSYDGRSYLIGECKFKGGAFRYSEYRETVDKTPWKGEGIQVYYYLFSSSGFDDKLAEEAEHSEYIMLCSLKDLINPI